MRVLISVFTLSCAAALGWGHLAVAQTGGAAGGGAAGGAASGGAATGGAAAAQTTAPSANPTTGAQPVAPSGAGIAGGANTGAVNNPNGTNAGVNNPAANNASTINAPGQSGGTTFGSRARQTLNGQLRVGANQAGVRANANAGVNQNGANQNVANPNANTANATNAANAPNAANADVAPNAANAPTATNAPNANNAPPAPTAPNALNPAMNTNANGLPANSGANNPPLNNNANSGLAGQVRYGSGFGIADGPDGMRISALRSGSAAAAAGLQVGDQLISVNGQRITSESQLQSEIESVGARNTPLLLGVSRDGRFQMVEVRNPAAGATTSTNPTTGTMNGTAGATGAMSAGFGQGLTFAGSATAGIGAGTTPGEATNASATAATDANGDLLITQVAANSWAADVGFHTNDRLVSINGQPLSNQFSFESQLQAAAAGGAPFQVMVNRNGQQVPLYVSGRNGMQGGSPLTGNFSTDFDRWAGDFGTALDSARTNYQRQISELTTLGDRVSTLRAGVLSSQDFDRAHLTQEWQSLRNDLNALSGRSSGEFQSQLNLLRERLNHIDPTSGSVGSAAAGASATTAAGTTANSATTPGATTPSGVNSTTSPDGSATTNAANPPDTVPR